MSRRKKTGCRENLVEKTEEKTLQELDYFDDLEFIGVNRCVTSSNRGLRVNYNYSIGIMLRGPALLYCGEGKAAFYQAPFLYWSSIKSSKNKRGSAWRTPPGVERENLWMDLRGERAERMLDSLTRAVGGKENYLYLERPEKLCEIFERLRKCFQRSLPSEKFHLHLLMEEFMAAVGEILSSSKGKNKLEKFVDDLVQKIKEDPGKEYDIRKIAAESAVSESYFRRCFQQYMKISFHQFLLLQKYDFALRLLRNSTLSISEIAEKCNFSTARQFTAFFKKYARLSPLQFRKTLY